MKKIYKEIQRLQKKVGELTLKEKEKLDRLYEELYNDL